MRSSKRIIYTIAERRNRTELYKRLIKEKDETIRQKDEVLSIYKKQQKEK